MYKGFLLGAKLVILRGNDAIQRSKYNKKCSKLHFLPRFWVVMKQKMLIFAAFMQTYKKLLT